MPDENIFKKIGDGIANYAPTLAGILGATGIGTPAAAAVGALGTIAKMFGLGSGASPEEIHDAIQADPEAALKLRLAEMDFVLKKRDQDIEELRVQMTPYIEGLKTTTIPWVDALHKMSRSIQNVLIMIAVVVLMLASKTITPEIALLLGGGNVAYQLIKGKGNPTS
jgi:hypothetical protein